MQPAAEPEVLRSLGFSEVALGQPRRAYDNLALAHAIVRDILHVGIDDAQLDERNRPPGTASVRHALVRR